MPLASPSARPEVVHGFGRIDVSGRVADRATIAALGWRRGDRLTVTADAGVMVARRDPGGMVKVFSTRNPIRDDQYGGDALIAKMHRDFHHIFTTFYRTSVSTLTADDSATTPAPVPRSTGRRHTPLSHVVRPSRISPRHQHPAHFCQRVHLPARVGDGAGHGLGLLVLAGFGQCPGRRCQRFRLLVQVGDGSGEGLGADVLAKSGGRTGRGLAAGSR